MRRCDICGMAIEGEGRFHAPCLRGLFGVPHAVDIRLSLAEVPIQAQKMAGRMSISGVQPKLSMARKGNTLIPIGSGGQYILKPQTQTYRNLPENEQLCMNIAARLDINMPAHGLFDLTDGTKAYVVRRFDRTMKGERRRCEDFSQILGSTDKYAGSVEQIGKRIRGISEVPGLDAQLLFERVLLSFLIGNGDAHLKNYSMLETDAGALRLSPAYDIVCSKLLIPDEEDSALTINGKHNRIKRDDFYAYAKTLGIPERVRDAILYRMKGIVEIARHDVPGSYLPAEDQQRMLDIVEERWDRIFS